jgi:hypothetical protein
VWPAEVDLAKSRMMLDVAEGTAPHRIGAMRHWPKLKAVVFDAPSSHAANRVGP